MAPATMLATGLGDQADNPTGAPFLILLGVFLVVLAGSVVFGKRLQSRRNN
jgi:hypothetical protein